MDKFVVFQNFGILHVLALPNPTEVKLEHMSYIKL